MPTGYTTAEIIQIAIQHLETVRSKALAAQNLIANGAEDEVSYYRAFMVAASQRLVILFTDIPPPPP